MSYDLFSITGKTALITGGTSGIGLMIAEGYLRAGARIYISSRKPDACAAAQDALAEFGAVQAIPADVSTEDGCRALIDAVAERTDSLDILVNKAGATWGACSRRLPPTPSRPASSTSDPSTGSWCPEWAPTPIRRPKLRSISSPGIWPTPWRRRSW